MHVTFPVLIHYGFYKILRESPGSVRARVQKTLLRLQEGYWGGGTRVKRLAGIGQAVFEARVDSGSRLLFTAVRAADRENPEQLITHLQVWDVVHHDAVTRRARRNLVPEAEFLDFKAIEEFEITEPPPHPAAAFHEVSADGAEPLLHFLIPADGFESRAAEGISGGVRWYLAPPFMLADESEFQRIIDQSGAELELKLMRDQYEILRTPGPLLLAGSAGSGKTTIAIHRLVEARSQIESGRLLYLSYSPWLVDYARQLYRDVTVARGGDAQTAPPHFFTVSDLYKKLIPSEELLADGNLITCESFTAWLERSSPRVDPALVWEELRSILKGACLNLGRPMLEEREYYELGRKRAPLFVNERPEIFGIAQRYQQWISSTARMDQIDLCRRALRQVRHGRGGKYDVIVCDESQDLTELEIAFVLSLSANPNLSGVMLAGDTQQIVNPTGFRWADARQSIMKSSGARSAPKVARLRRNCRSVRPLVELANSVLTLKQDIFGRYEEDGLEDAVVEGPAPIQIAEEERRVLEAVRDFGPRCAILVLDEAEGHSLSRMLDTTRIFHVRDAKGLEFETVILWKLLKSANGLIERFLREDPRIEKDARFKQFLQHLYVAVTRGRRHLAIYEGPEAHAFWNSRRFRRLLDTESAGMLGRFFRESASVAEWAKEGDYYRERMRYRQAAECYRRAGLETKETEALAMFSESLEDWSAALQRWQLAGRLDRQGVLLEKLGRISEAIEIYRKLNQADDASRLEITLLEKQGRWAEAGKRWELSGNEAEAARCYQRAGNTARALALEAGIAENNGDWKRAAECWMQLKSFESAGRCFRKSKDRKNAALASAFHHESLKDWTGAAKDFKRAGEKRKSEECRAIALETQGDLLMAARIRERLGDKDRALHLYRKSGDQDAIDRFAVERADLKQPQFHKITELRGRGKFQLALKLANSRRSVLQKRGSTRRSFYSEADEEIYLLEDQIAECRALMAEQSQNWQKAAQYWRRAGNGARAEAAQEKAIESLPDLTERGIARMKLGEYEKAIEAFQSAGDSTWLTAAHARLCERQKQWKQAADHWASIGRTDNHAACMAELARSADNWAEAAGWHHAAGQRTLAAEAERLAKSKRAAEAATIRKQHASLF